MTKAPVDWKGKSGCRPRSRFGSTFYLSGVLFINILPLLSEIIAVGNPSDHSKKIILALYPK